MRFLSLELREMFLLVQKVVREYLIDRITGKPYVFSFGGHFRYQLSLWIEGF